MSSERPYTSVKRSRAAINVVDFNAIQVFEHAHPEYFRSTTARHGAKPGEQMATFDGLFNGPHKEEFRWYLAGVRAEMEREGYRDRHTRG